MASQTKKSAEFKGPSVYLEGCGLRLNNKFMVDSSPSLFNPIKTCRGSQLQVACLLPTKFIRECLRPYIQNVAIYSGYRLSGFISIRMGSCQVVDSRALKHLKKLSGVNVASSLFPRPFFCHVSSQILFQLPTNSALVTI
jgi:hypothetical protein